MFPRSRSYTARCCRGRHDRRVARRWTVPRRKQAMIERASRALNRRVLIVDDALSQGATTEGRSVRSLADELRGRGVDVVEALSCEDGLASVVSAAGMHCVFVSWTLGTDDSLSHARVTDLLRALRA